MFRNFDVNNDSFFSYFTFLRTLMYQFFAAIVRVAALRRESQLGATHFSWKNTYVFTYFFSWFFLKCMDAPWGALGALGHLFGGSGAHNWSQKRIMGYIISSLVMKLYVCVEVLVHVHSFCVMSMCRWMHTDVYRCTHMHVWIYIHT